MAVELKLVVAARDVNQVGNLEHGLESNSLLSDIPSSSIGCSFLSTLSNACHGLKLCKVKPYFIAVGSQVVLVILSVKIKTERRYDTLAVGVVVRILDELQEKMSWFLI